MKNEMLIEGNYTTVKTQVTNQQGIHSRPSAIICIRASKYDRESYLTCIESPTNPARDTTKEYRCKSVLDLMSIEAPCGTVLKLHVEGTDETAKAICKDLENLISSNLETIIVEIAKEKS